MSVRGTNASAARSCAPSPYLDVDFKARVRGLRQKTGRDARPGFNALVLALALRSLPGLGLAVLSHRCGVLPSTAAYCPTGVRAPLRRRPGDAGLVSIACAAVCRIRRPFSSPTGWWKVTTLSTVCRRQCSIAHKKRAERRCVLIMCERTSGKRSENPYFPTSCPEISRQVARNAVWIPSMSLLQCRKTSTDKACRPRGLRAGGRRRLSRRLA